MCTVGAHAGGSLRSWLLSVSVVGQDVCGFLNSHEEGMGTGAKEGPRTDRHLAWGGQGLGAQGWSRASPGQVGPRAPKTRPREPRGGPSLPAPGPLAVPCQVPASPALSFPPTGRMYSGLLTRKKPLKHLGNVPGQKTETLKLPHRLKCSYSTYNQE